MTVATTSPRNQGGYLSRPSPSGLADVLDIILDKGIVIDAYVRVSLVGIEILTIDARIVIASVDTYLRFAEATNRLDLYQKGGQTLPDLVEDLGSSAASAKTHGVISGAKKAITGKSDESEEERPRRRSSSSSGSRTRRRAEQE
ncbi:gas vesicle protein GvpJ [Oryzihumus sp.]